MKHCLSFEAPYGPMHRVAEGFIWCGTDAITDDVPSVRSAKYELINIDLLHRLTLDFGIRVAWNRVAIINADGSLVSQQSAEVADAPIVRFENIDDIELPAIFRLSCQGAALSGVSFCPCVGPLMRSMYGGTSTELIPILLAVGVKTDS